MDSTFVINQVTIPEIHTQVVNHPDSLIVTIVDPLTIAQDSPELIFGMTQEMAAIVIPTVATLLVFIIGGIAKLIYDWIVSIIKTRTYKNTIFVWTDCIRKATNSQITKVNALADAIAANNTIQAVRFEFSKSMANKLDTLTADNVIKHFVFNSTNTKDKANKRHAFNFVSQFDFLASAEEAIIESYHVYNQQSFALLEPWNESVLAIGRLVGGIPEPQDIDLHAYLCSIYGIWSVALSQGGQEIDVIVTNRVFLTPLSEYLEKHQEFTGSPLYGQLLHHSNMLKIVIKRWEFLSRGYENNFRDYADSMNTSINKLMESKELLKATYSYK